jgi:hypothetical protein
MALNFEVSQNRKNKLFNANSEAIAAFVSVWVKPVEVCSRISKDENSVTPFKILPAVSV